MEYICTSCRARERATAEHWRCPACGGIFDLADRPPFRAGAIDASAHGLWRYRVMLRIPEGAQPVTLGEGTTPLVLTKGQLEQLLEHLSEHFPNWQEMTCSDLCHVVPQLFPELVRLQKPKPPPVEKPAEPERRSLFSLLPFLKFLLASLFSGRQ